MDFHITLKHEHSLLCSSIHRSKHGETHQGQAADDNHEDDEGLEVLVLDQEIRLASQVPTQLTST